VKIAIAAMLCAACTGSTTLTDRQRLIVNVLAADNEQWSLREPSLVAMKLAKMQRSPFLWLRGTAAVYWRDLTEPGAAVDMTFVDPASARVLIDGDPHPENVGTFRASDGTLVVDWDDFDTAGYGPFEGDLRRCAAGLIVAAADDSLADPIARAVAAGYTTQLGAPVADVGMGANAYLDKQLGKAQENGDAGKDLDEIAPIGDDGARHLALGDIDPVGDDGVIENRLVALTPSEQVFIASSIAQWSATHPGHGALVLAARKLGSGVSSYAAWRYDAVLADDTVLELKEERDGIAIAAEPRYAAAEWTTPAARVVDAQLRMQSRSDEDPELGAAEATPLSLRVHAETAYQRGLDNEDLAALAAGSDDKRAELVGLAQVLGGMLARAHGQAITEDGVRGDSVIRIDDADAFADEISRLAQADAAQTVTDWESMKDMDLASLVIP
jgi:uncharacterized protein (DUF2252 family)